jgi:hypothetical protein
MLGAIEDHGMDGAIEDHIDDGGTADGGGGITDGTHIIRGGHTAAAAIQTTDFIKKLNLF